MMTPIDRRIVECVKASKGITVVINPKDRNNRLTLHLSESRKLSHDIALAIQDYFNNN